MSQAQESIDDRVKSFIAKQHMFFIATAPLAGNGHVNLSPKGMDTFRVIDEHTVGYADYRGSGAETVAHLRENGRVVICFCAFEGAPNILRLHGTGRAVERCDPEWGKQSKHFHIERGVRALIVVDVTRVADSCGWAVPLYDHIGQREQLRKSIAAKSDEVLIGRVKETNTISLDGLPALRDPEGIVRPS